MVQISAKIEHVSAFLLSELTAHLGKSFYPSSTPVIFQAFEHYYRQRKDLGLLPYQLLLAWSSDKLMLVSQYLQKLLHSISKERKSRLKNTNS